MSMPSGDYSAKEKMLINEIVWDKLPQHVAFIMDGNGRWAQKRKLPRINGHKQGVETLRKIVSFSNNINICAITFFAFSTENWKRPVSEVDFLLNLPDMYLEKDLPELKKNNVRVTVIGDFRVLPDNSRKSVEKALEETRNNTGMVLNLAINYGGRDEILRSVRYLSKKVLDGELAPENIEEKTFTSFLYTSEVNDPDLVIRTSGEKRISNFLLWQIAYSELWFTSVFWPDFTRSHLLEAILEYQRRQRRFGGVIY